MQPAQLSAPTPCREWDVRALVGHMMGVVVNMGRARAARSWSTSLDHAGRRSAPSSAPRPTGPSRRGRRAAPTARSTSARARCPSRPPWASTSSTPRPTRGTSWAATGAGRPPPRRPRGHRARRRAGVRERPGARVRRDRPRSAGTGGARARPSSSSPSWAASRETCLTARCCHHPCLLGGGRRARRFDGVPGSFRRSRTAARRVFAVVATVIVATAAGCGNGGGGGGGQAQPSSTSKTKPAPSSSSTTAGGSTASSAAAPPSGLGAQPCQAVAPPATYAHVVVVMLENRTWSQVGGPGFSAMPYLRGLAAHCAYYGDWSETNRRQSSLTQYIGLTSGVDNPRTVNDCARHAVFVDRRQPLPPGARGGRTARNYVEGATAPCSAAGNAPEHIPALDYRGTYTDASGSHSDTDFCTLEVRPLTELDPNHLPTFAMVAPTLCHDGHDCPNARWTSGCVASSNRSSTAPTTRAVTPRSSCSGTRTIPFPTCSSHRARGPALDPVPRRTPPPSPRWRRSSASQCSNGVSSRGRPTSAPRPGSRSGRRFGAAWAHDDRLRRLVPDRLAAGVSEDDHDRDQEDAHARDRCRRTG